MENTETEKVDIKTDGHVGTVVALGALAAGAAAAGYYFYASENAEENRKKAASWANSFKKEVAKQLEKGQVIDRETIAAAVDKAVGIYGRLRAIDAADLMYAARELKTHWQQFSDELIAQRKRKTAPVGKPARRSGARRKKKAE
jgi:hypothetical protein